jgi:hypothetical protein
MPLPNTSEGLKAAGYQYKGDAHCRGCGATIEWWFTPNARNMPFSIVKADPAVEGDYEKRVAHWTDCPRAGDFRRK